MSTIDFGPQVDSATYEQRLREERERITGPDWKPPGPPSPASMPKKRKAAK